MCCFQGKIISDPDEGDSVDQGPLCEAEGMYPVEEQGLDGFHSDQTLRLRQGVDDPILQMKTLRSAEAGSIDTEGNLVTVLILPPGGWEPWPMSQGLPHLLASSSPSRSVGT